MVRTVLITGFGPFPGAPFNPTEKLVERLATRRHPRLAHVRRIAHVFPTSYAAVDEAFDALIAHHRPDVVLMFGLAARTPHLRIETRAANVVSALLSDAGGQLSGSRSIGPGGRTWRRGRALFPALLTAARRTRIPVRLSCDAGRYLCNYVYWRALDHPPVKVPIAVFVHVPALARKLTPQGRRRPHPSFNAVLRAAEAILLALVSSVRTRR